LLVALAIPALLAAGPVPASAQRKKLGALAPPVRLVNIHRDVISVAGLHRYYATIELGSASDGIAVSNILQIEQYLYGLNEVPTDWPFEALKAQAVAARTYAFWTMAQPPGGLAAVYDFDICATVQCQVFSGADVILESGGSWQQAVDDTAGLAILYDDVPILARYHSTSGGRTLDNPQAFPDERSYPYLQGVTSTTEEASPLYKWTVTFRRDRLTKILRHAGLWSGGRIASVVSVPSRSGKHYPDLIVRGTDAAARMTAEEFRTGVRESAPAVYPDRYPSAWHTTSGVLPETLPSNRVRVFTRGPDVVVQGRGWGHGVGMSQWGAHGLARQGASFEQILDHYYTGTSVEHIPTDFPIEVGVAFAQPTVTASGNFRIFDGNGRIVVRNAIGTWRFVDEGGAIGVDPPQGYGLPLEVGIVKAPKRVQVAEPAFLTIALSRPAEVRAETVGMSERFPKTRVKSAGKRRVTWLAPVQAGRYKVRVRVKIGKTTRVSETVPILVTETEPPPRAEAEEDGGDPSNGAAARWALIGAGLAVALILVVSVALSRRGSGSSGG